MMTHKIAQPAGHQLPGCHFGRVAFPVPWQIPGVAVFVCILVLWIFSISLHEYAHARVALAGGDFTVRDKGYLEFNPLHYVDPVVSILLPVIMLLAGGIGLPGGAVWINRELIRSKAWQCAVSLAGPASNLALAILVAMLFRIGIIPMNMENTLSVTMAFFVYLQITCFIFNLLPLPGFDGMNALLPWLPLEIRETIMRLPPYTSMIVLLLLWQTHFASHAINVVAFIFLAIFGIDPELAFQGYSEFKFWH